MAHAILAILLASAIATTLVGRRANNAVSQGDVWCHGSWHSGEQAAQIAIALFADTAELVLAPARVLLWYKADPGRKIPSASEGLWISDTGDQSGGERGTNAGNLIQPFARLVGSVPGNNLTVKVENLHL